MYRSRTLGDDNLSKNDYALHDAMTWFAEHVTLDSKPYTLDTDQARAATDEHKNTLVTARAGSGKTRVIVAKVAYLVAKKHLSLDEIAIFMFNRTAAAEVNQRIAAICVDGQNLAQISTQNTHQFANPASTFHKYALDIVKRAGENPQIIDSAEQETIIRQALDTALQRLKRRVSLNEYRELFGLVTNFVTRAGQKFPGHSGLTQLRCEVQNFCETTTDPKLRFYHQVSYLVYAAYLQGLHSPQIDFNLLMSRAAEILEQSAKIPDDSHQNTTASSSKTQSPDTPSSPSNFSDIRHLKYLMIDEYQDFSYLFFTLTAAIRQLAPSAKLFAVGDDWQAINRFAGSDVDYFLNFAHYFPENYTNIPLATNYRSASKIVECANRYMLSHYDPKALPAQAFNHEYGKIKVLNPLRLRFDKTDIREDGLGDGRFQTALAKATGTPIAKTPLGAAQLLKQIYKIIQRHRHSEIMLLHRHNFTSFAGLTLENLHFALRDLVIHENIMTDGQFDQQVRILTMHKSKGLESEVVILLEMNPEIIKSHHPHATIFPLFGDNLAAETADQDRLIYVALTRAKRRLYLLSNVKTPLD